MDATLEELKYPIGKYQRPDTYTPESMEEWILALRVLPSWMDASIENLDEHQLHIPYRDGGWTIQQVVHHVADSHMNMYIRLKLALTENNPTITAYDENAWAQLPDVAAIPVNVSVTLLHALHRRIVALMEQMTPEDWQRTYYHPQYDRVVPLWEVAALYAWHGRHHTGHIQQLRQRMNWQ